MTSLRPRAPRADGPPADVSVAIPCLDGGERLLRLVRAAGAQRGVGRVEILLADSGSRDGSIETIAAERPDVRLFDVLGGFDHGLVRTALVEAATAPLVALFSQDAVPIGAAYLATLVACFDDARVIGAYARQVARPNADPLQIATLSRWTPPPTGPDSEPQVRHLADASLDALPPTERIAAARFDNVGSMVRRDALLELPFPARPFGEDLAWGAAALRAGHALAYAPGAAVEHSHPPTLRGTFARHRVAHRQAASEFGLRTVPSLPAAAMALALGLPGDLRDGGATWAIRGLPRRASALLGQWLGGREGSR